MIVAFGSRFRSTSDYFMRAISEISYHLVSLKERFRNRLIPAITGGHIFKDTEGKPLFYLLVLVDLQSLFFMNKPK